MQQPYYPPPRPQGSGNGWIVIVLGIAGGGILIVGILAVLAISGVTRYLKAAKTAEARNTLGQLSMEATSAYEQEDMSGAHALCRSASAPVPRNPRSISGVKYQSIVSDWTKDAPDGGFACLKFQMDYPQYFQYNYTITGTGKSVGDSYTIEARGDLDGNGVYSSFTIGGRITTGDVLLSNPSIKELNPDE